jgi:hypothetical protein
MIFERENVKPIINPSDKMIALNLKRIGHNKNSAFASIVADDGSWIQVGGGGVTCMIEKREPNNGRIFRGWQAEPVMPPEFDGTVLYFSGNSITLGLKEWFRIEQVIDVFIAFNNRMPLPAYICWREITHILLSRANNE